MKILNTTRSRLIFACFLCNLLPAALLHAGQLDGALDASRTGEQYLNVSLVPMLQRATNAGESTGNYTFDVIAKLTLLDKPEGASIGNTDLIVWVNSSDKIGGWNSTPELSEKAGLLWDTNDIGSDSSSTSYLVLGIEQWLLQDQLSIGAGKFFPGQYFLTSPYTADNSNNFTSKMISSNPVVSWWEAIGLGINSSYALDDWFFQFAIVDGQAEEDIDFSSFSEGNYAYIAEAKYSWSNEEASSSLGLVFYGIDETQNRESEYGWVGQFTHEFGAKGSYAAFGRYSWREDGESRNSDPTVEQPVTQGAFLGVALNRPWNNDKHQLAAVLMYGKAADYKAEAGFNNQKGVEFFWNWKPNPWLSLIPNLQLMENNDSDLEPVIGLRIALSFERNWPESSVLSP